MATCNANELLATDPCLVTLTPHELHVVRVQLLCNLLDKIQNSGEVTCDIATLIDQGKCFVNVPDHLLDAIEIQLLCDISNAL